MRRGQTQIFSFSAFVQLSLILSMYKTVLHCVVCTNRTSATLCLTPTRSQNCHESHLSCMIVIIRTKVNTAWSHTQALVSRQQCRLAQWRLTQDMRKITDIWLNASQITYWEWKIWISSAAVGWIWIECNRAPWSGRCRDFSCRPGCNSKSYNRAFDTPPPIQHYMKACGQTAWKIWILKFVYRCAIWTSERLFIL